MRPKNAAVKTEMNRSATVTEYVGNVRAIIIISLGRLELIGNYS